MMGRDRGTAWEVLAGLRWMLAVVVACGHASLFFGDADAVTAWVGSLGGKAAVVGFLMVSGYSIAASVTARPDGFLRRRWLRIYPLYLVAVVFAVVLEGVLGGVAVMPSGMVVHGSSVPEVLGNLLFLQTFLVKPIGFDGPVWSLAIEVAFYAAAPLLYRVDRRWVVALLVVSAVAYVAPRRDDWGLAYHVVTRLNAVVFAWAWLLGFLLHGARGVRVFGGCGLLAALLVWGNGYLNPEPLAPVLVLAVAGGMALAAGVLRLGALPRVGKAVLQYAGDLSYPFYLLHFPAMIAAAACGVTQPLPALACAVAVSAVTLAVVDGQMRPAVQRWVRRAVLRRVTA